MLAEIAATQTAGKTVGGHYASPDLGQPFHAYAAGGPADDHEGTRVEDAIARVRQGMRAMLRLGSAWYDVAAQIKAVTERGLDPRNFILCTDDCHSGTLVNDGHMNRVVRHAIAQGLKPVTAIQMATLNTAQHFGLERELGSITPGRRADLILTSDLADAADRDGDRPRPRAGARTASSTPTSRPIAYPGRARKNTVQARHASSSADDFDITAPEGRQRGDGPRHRRHREPGADPGAGARPRGATTAWSRWIARSDVCQIALVERHRGTGTVVNAFVSGFGYNADCAVASTVAHDSHHMIVVGTNKRRHGPGRQPPAARSAAASSWSRKGKELALVELPIAGLMSDERAEIVAAKAEQAGRGHAACGCTPQQRLHAAFAAGAGGHSRTAHFRRRA